MTETVFQLGEPAEHRGIVVAPLFPRHDPVAAYLTLDEALPTGLRIAETSESGSVPELVVENPLDARVLLYDGEELVGAKQNRILNVSVLVGGEVASSRSPSPASSRGAGRDARRTSRPAPHVSHRAAAAAQGGGAGRASRSHAASRSARSGTRCTRRPSGCEVARRPGRAPTSTARHERDLRALERAFPLQPGQCGAILALGDDALPRLVSRPDAFARLWPKLRAGYLLDALERLDGRATSTAELGAFVGRGARPSGRRAAVGRARRGRPAARRARSIGSGLELDGELHPALGVPERRLRPRASAGSRARAGGSDRAPSLTERNSSA